MGVVEQDMTPNKFAVLQLHVVMISTFISSITCHLRTGWLWFLFKNHRIFSLLHDEFSQILVLCLP